ncbi:MAG TPA: hypothetical protein VG389_13025 [Myxococcota bacterium]|jgi:hypothetical protein|nr:hypothetical protein [Myxococcota bacterium]
MLVTRETPRWKIAEALRRGERAYFLAIGDDSGAIQPRLSRPIGDYRTDLDALVEAPFERREDLVAQKEATAAKHGAVKRGHRLVMRARRAARKRAPEAKALHKALGVGDDLDAADVDGVLVGLAAMVEHGGAAGDGLLPIGLLPEDVTAAAALAVEIRADRNAQRAKMGERVGGTDEREAVHVRVEATIDEVALAGMTAFRDDRVHYALYAELVADAGTPASTTSGAAGADPPVSTPPALPPSSQS